MRVMIICVCRRLNDRAVREAIAAGADTPDAIQAHHGCAFNCGRCRDAMGEMLAEARGEAEPYPYAIAAE